MLNLHENEQVVMTVRRHWFVMARTAVTFFILILVPVVLAILLPFIEPYFDPGVFGPTLNFFASLYMLVLLVFIFLAWMDYYLDMWIITNRRIIDVEQRGLFSREISEIPMARVQDVTIEVHGLIETFLKFGTIRVQTAGERAFDIRDIPHLYAVKDIILKYADKNGRAFQMEADKT